MAKHWADFQYEIYLNGMTGAVPRLPTDLTRLEELTERRLGPGPVGYVMRQRGRRQHRPRQPGRPGPPPDRAAHAAGRP